MKNYIDEVIRFNQFIDDNPKLAKNAEFAKEYLKGFYGRTDEEDFIVIEVEGYKCVAVLTDDFAPYTVGDHIAPFDENRTYPLQGLETTFNFKRYKRS